MFQRTFTRVLPEPLKLPIAKATIEILRTTNPDHVRLDDEVIRVLSDHLSAHVNALRIIDVTMCDVKAVTDQLHKIGRQATNVKSAVSLAKSTQWLSKLRKTLTVPSDPKTEAEIARHIALDFLAVKFETVEAMRSGRPLTSVISTKATLTEIDWTGENLHRLLKYVAQAEIEVAQTNDDAQEAIHPAVGRLPIDGKPFDFQPYPIRESRVSPKGKALADFAKQMVLVYRWMGGQTKIHKDGTGVGAEPAHDFMLLLTAMTAAMPEQFRPMRRDSLHSRAPTYLFEERRCPAQ